MIYKLLFKAVYNILFIIKKKDNDKAVMVLYRTSELEGNLKYVYDELKLQLPNIKIHFVYSRNKMNLGLFKELVVLADAKYIILDDYYLPVYLIKPKRNQKVIQLWHAAGAFKKFGHSTIGTRFGPSKEYLKLVPIHSNYTHVYVSSSNIMNYYAEAFNMSVERIYPVGIPRIDLFNRKDDCKRIERQIYHENPSLKNGAYVNVLFAPTYRAKGPQEETPFDVIQFLLENVRQLDDQIKIIFKPHPYMDAKLLKRLESLEKIVFAKGYSINEWMLVSDAFITDYSSAIFEYALLKRPLAHLVPDHDAYETGRGFYQSIRDISAGEILENNHQFISWVNAKAKDEYFGTEQMIYRNFDNTKNVTRKVVEHFIGGF